MRETISFETTILTDTINIPEECRDAMPVHASQTEEKHGKNDRRRNGLLE